MPPKTSNFWNDENTEKMRSMWLDGWSASQIAEVIGAVSRNVVIGKVNRLGITRNPGMSKRRRNRTTQSLASRKANAMRCSLNNRKAVKPVERKIYTPPPEPVVPLHIPLISLEKGQCKYPYGDGPFTHCGHVTKGIYCDYHNSVCYYKGV